MTSMPVNQLSIELLANEFFEQSAGRWKSQRRYYTLKQDVEPQEVVSDLTIRFLEQGSPELVKLAQLHQLEDKSALLSGTEVTWESNYTGKSRKPSVGSTIIGVKENILYRDRGFATTEPVIATYSFSNPKTLCLRTEYGGSVFEEEIKLIGDNYRTRQTIISRAGQELTIGQYLEKRLA
ncbi:phycobiliprotein lyase [Candidatus Gracilibacteria bacterium]|nr:phycobiliprotein lyase [Candidatus Gracilibacteria bacterium]NJM88934.1 phycobiliprotein lyase [Hydrococcus sp. RU_2_2]NJP20809.1 phycobiliprotein lyase [Hydrococcus sp. CRU_1_1]NJQ96642.1 phycobiliprotein lyase [Hydrococcus sp. CSU_1_8]